MRYYYERLDVFTDRPFGGNPLAVFLDAEGLDAATMQRIAGELNLSETVFLTPADLLGEWHARIFTPAVELPFAGHPTVGAAIALAQAGRLGEAKRVVLHETVGPVLVNVDGGTASFEVPAAPEVREALPAQLLPAMLNLPEPEILGGAWRPRAVSCGVPFHIVALRNRAAIGGARLQLDLWQEHMAAHWAPHLYLVTTDTDGDADIRARMFAPAMGVAEDPATGGAAAALAGFLAAAMPDHHGHQKWRIEQGVEMGRPSRIELSAELADGGAHRIRVGGAAIVLGGGHLDLAGERACLQPGVISLATAPRYIWGDGCEGWRLLDHQDLAVIHERMPPGRSECRHVHARARQLFVMLSGSLEIEFPGRTVAIAAGEAIEVPPLTPHRVRNHSAENAEFLVISSPSTRGDRTDFKEDEV